MRRPAAILSLLRPSHWIKNLFVLAGVFFSGYWKQPEMLARALAAFAAFSLAASAVYCFNDFMDAEADRNHPRKRGRPVAAGVLSPNAALGLSGMLVLLALATSLFAALQLRWILAAYFTINILYSRGLKHQVLLDVFCIASGFILRLLAGTWGLGIEPSRWFLLCTLALSLFLGFSKRYAELGDDGIPRAEMRPVLRNYSPEFLRLLIGVTLSATLITYALYTTSARTEEIHHTGGLIYTLPLVMWGLFRYLYLVMSRGFGENTVADILRDAQMLFISVIYLLATGCLLFWGTSIR